MALSYSLRLVCLIVCSVGTILIACEMMLWTLAPLILRLIAGSPARRREMVLYGVQMLPVALALGSTAIGLVPDYVIHETNFARERVGWVCLALGFGIVLWFGRALARAGNLLIETARFTRACRRGGEGVFEASGGTSILAVRGVRHGLALVGLVRPFILISSSLLEDGGLAPPALEIALDHERAHARRRDNWKMFSLHGLPLLGLRLRDGKTWMQHWRNAAECAADDDAVRGESARAMMLAETLVAFGRNASMGKLPVASTALVCGETDLVARVERLLQPAAAGRPKDREGMVLLWSTLLGGAVALAIILPSMGDLPEHLLHLG